MGQGSRSCALQDPTQALWKDKQNIFAYDKTQLSETDKDISHRSNIYPKETYKLLH